MLVFSRLVVKQVKTPGRLRRRLFRARREQDCRFVHYNSFIVAVLTQANNQPSQRLLSRRPPLTDWPVNPLFLCTHHRLCCYRSSSPWVVSTDTSSPGPPATAEWEPLQRCTARLSSNTSLPR